VDDRKSSEALISILRSTSFLLEHYGYGGHDPSLRELQRTILRAISNLQPEMTVGDIPANRFNGHGQQ
jgi:hypothetical protein